jgi:hypothetical protein
MALRGSAALAMWWDMAPGMQKEFENWHTHEHFPERLGIPGFLRSSRWTDADRGEGVFVLYELDTFAVLSSAPYLARLNAPTPWSTALMPHHRNMVRAQSHVEASYGGVVARYATTLRFSIGAGSAHALMAAVLPQFQKMTEEAGAVGAHILRHETPRIEQTVEQKIRGVADTPGDWVLIACGYAREGAERMVQRISTDATFRDLATEERKWNTYALSYSALPSDVM